MDIEAAETEKHDAAWDEYRRPGDGGSGGGGRGVGTAPGINVGRKDKYVRVPNDPNAMSNKQQPTLEIDTSLSSMRTMTSHCTSSAVSTRHTA